MLSTEATLVLVPRKLRDGWVVATEFSGRGQRITISDPAQRPVVVALILFHFVNRRQLYPSAADALRVAREIVRRYGGTTGHDLGEKTRAGERGMLRVRSIRRGRS
jgi:hypothetical protein